MLTASVPLSREDAGNPGDQLLDVAREAGVPCRTNPDLWFAEHPGDLERAKSLCTDCPIKAECLAGALSRAEPWGVWGGEIFDRGAVVARKRPRGRPRKNAEPIETSRCRTGSASQECAA